MNHAKSMFFLLCVLPFSTAAAEDTKIVSDEFLELRAHLHGNWVGEYTNGTIDEPDEWRPVEIRYALTAGGSAIVEDYHFDDSGIPTMTTVYYPDGKGMQLTHYCGAQNHPRMEWTGYDEDTRTYGFRFLDITNLHDDADYHSRSLDLSFVTDDSIVLAYSGDMEGKTSVQTFKLVRQTAD